MKRTIILLTFFCAVFSTQSYAQNALLITPEFKPITYEEWLLPVILAQKSYDDGLAYLDVLVKSVLEILSNPTIDEKLRSQLTNQYNTLKTYYYKDLSRIQTKMELKAIELAIIENINDYKLRYAQGNTASTQATTSNSSNISSSNNSHSQSLQTTSQKPKVLATITKNAHLKNSYGEKVTTIAKGCSVEIISREGKWYKVKIRHLEGYMDEKFLKF